MNPPKRAPHDVRDSSIIPLLAGPAGGTGPERRHCPDTPQKGSAVTTSVRRSSPPTEPVRLSSERAAPQLQLLGGFELVLDGGRVTLPVSAQRLLAFLALHRHPLMRVYVAGTLWIDSSERHANACLRTTLWRLR